MQGCVEAEGRNIGRAGLADLRAIPSLLVVGVNDETTFDAVGDVELDVTI